MRLRLGLGFGVSDLDDLLGLGFSGGDYVLPVSVLPVVLLAQIVFSFIRVFFNRIVCFH